MSRQIQPVGGRPVLLQRSANYTKIAVKQVVGLDGRVYDMLFIGTGKSQFPLLVIIMILRLKR